ncbi:putative mitochondrial hypothetical protein [Leptomonas pyrrhocoris]|uniref:Uncharacterized protein n=1 Tax=Leptomonas pyrrhocoris TaxID=157538 RepID=A0A0M9G4J6_LEPPY|nr:putative mitochondrial hypothetical protein [Leptomonas pyrrhocoris]XP_015660562.1 putative mitochondrial hypothetical protein [Leptomonas pyrrhocoris]KPA82122.1 putative mitochondrial hypothetical protein [Leptomonas pyrrhocoris]KPA82123.1 putative mitochondrial hypothetical protein [Leptomonas pyrrhocoris]|eukprot:XP_015660561.1 putative mitochondrial hypothetical protein [Leptomonas pyrrhocoris]
MGQGNGTALAKDTLQAEQFLKYQEARHAIVHRAFVKCVVPSSTGKDDGYDLSPEERMCVEEFAILYAGFAKKGFIHFSTLYEQHQRDVYERARLEYMQQQARQEIQR